MKPALVCLLVLSMACSSSCAVAEGPIPVRALMQNAGAQSALPASSGDQSSPAPDVSQTAPHRPMTTGGKVMTGVGIGLLALGVAALATPQPKDGFAPAEGAVRATSILCAGVGVTLVVIGTHRRKAK
jgi:hypothetical protein